jgi:POT family proton-dependent oligopeptide transporter
MIPEALDLAGLVRSFSVYGWYTMLVYLMSIPGGMIADKLIGQKKAVLVGALLSSIGHGVLVLTQTWAFLYRIRTCGLRCRLLKPQYFDHGRGLYGQDICRDKGFSIFYWN